VKFTGDGYVYTVLTFEVEDRIMGFVPDRKIEIAIAGGLRDGILHTAMHNPISYKDRSGIYFLSKSKHEGNFYTVVQGNAGQIVRGDRGDSDRAIIAAMRTGEQPYRKVKERIGLLLGSDLSIRALTKDGYSTIQQLQRSELNGPTMCVKIANPTPNFANGTVEFDIQAKSSVQGIMFASADVVINYPTGNVGEWIVNQGKVEGEKGDISDDDIYTIDITDQTKNQMNVSITSNCNYDQDHYILDTVYEKLASVEIEVDTWGDFGTVNLDSFAIDGDAEYVVPPTFSGAFQCEPFDNLCGEHDGQFVIMNCTLNSINGIFHAGIAQTVTLSGSDFGDQSEARFFIPHAENGGLTRLEIQADDGKVVRQWNTSGATNSATLGVLNILGGSRFSPFSASSGEWQLQSNSLSMLCGADVEVGYSLHANNAAINSTLSREERYFYPLGGIQEVLGYPETGALSVYIDPLGIPNDINISDVEDALSEVICQWEDAAGVEINYIGPVTPPAGTPQDPSASRSTVVTISLGNNLSTRVGETNLAFGPGDICDTEVFDLTYDADININSATFDMYFGPEDQLPSDAYDFYSVLLHEFGHVLGHGHANDLNQENGTDDSRTMYFFLGEGESKRYIDVYGDDGASEYWEFTNSVTNSNRCTLDEATGILAIVAGCSTNFTSESSSYLKDFEVVSNGNKLTIILDGNLSRPFFDVSISNAIGQVLHNASYTATGGIISIEKKPSLETELLFVTLRSSAGNVYTKSFMP